MKAEKFHVLENEEYCCCNSIADQRPQNQGASALNPDLQAREDKTGCYNSGREKKSPHSPPSTFPFCCIEALNRWCLPHWRRKSALT
jgi:hypothetical protein